MKECRMDKSDTQRIDMIVVGMADSAVAKSPEKLTTLGLGSCIGITLYDPHVKVGGLVHIMLPNIKQARAKDNPAKFADAGILSLIDEMVECGALKRRMWAKIAGGAHMFSFSGNEHMKIGKRNIEETKLVLSELNIPLIAEDTGMNYGRTIIFDTNNGEFLVKSALKGIIKI